MVVKEDGSKWACRSCLKGHRVSGCNHTDRELIKVPKKGRPVTQCQHCRQERKKRSAHVSCDCGNAGKHHHPREKCIHLREAEERAKAGLREQPVAEKDPAHLESIKEEQGCCCGHGGKCSCSVLKRENEDPAAPLRPAVKPRLEKTSSDGGITQFVNGHHRPVHRKNHAAHEHGMPYRMPIPRSDSSHSSDYSASQSPEESTSLPYDQGPWLPLTSAAFPAGRRRSKSELTPPKLSTMQAYPNGLPDFTSPPVDFSLTRTGTNDSLYSDTSSSVDFPAFDQMSGFSEDDLEPWADMSALDTTTVKPINQNGMQYASSCSADAMYQPSMTAPSSVAPSDSDDIASIDSLYGMAIPNLPDSPAYDFDYSAPNSPNPNRNSLPPSFFGNTELTHGSMSSEWQTAVANSAAANHSRLSTSPQSMHSQWPQPIRRSTMSTSPAPFEATPRAGARPQSRSVGPSSAPNNDVLQQLFPEMDFGSIPAATQSQPHLLTRKTFHGMPTSMPTSAPTNFVPQPIQGSPQPMYGSPERGSGFLTSQQPWSYGSYAIPNDGFPRSVGYEGGGGMGYTSQPCTPPEWVQ